MLHVWLRAQHSPLAVWHADIRQWQTVAGWQQLQETYNSYKTGSQRTLCLYFPSSHVLQVDTELSSTQLKQLGMTGKQYLFEEMSLTPVEQLAIRQVGQMSSNSLYALAQSDIEIWQQSALLAGFTIGALLPDFLLLPIPEEGAGQQVVLYQDGYTTLLRQSERQGMAANYLPLIFERMPQLSEVCVLPALDSSVNLTVDSSSYPSVDVPMDTLQDNVDNNSNADSNKLVLNELMLQKTEQLSEVTTISDDSNSAAITALLAEQQLLLTTLSSTPVPVENAERHALNFFVKSSDSQLSPYLRVALMVALSALVLQIATDSVQWYRYSAAAAATQTAVAEQYQSWFPDEPLNTRNKLQTQVQPKLRNDSQAPASHMAILARISPLIKQSSLQAQALIMQPTALSFTLIAPDRGSLDKFASTLTEQGLVANLERVNSNEQGQFSGQIIVNIADDNANNVDNNVNKVKPASS